MLSGSTRTKVYLPSFSTRSASYDGIRTAFLKCGARKASRMRRESTESSSSTIAIATSLIVSFAADAESLMLSVKL